MSQTYDDILPKPGFEVDEGRTAMVITDPQRDFLSEDGVVWQVVGQSVEENHTVAHLAQLLTAAHAAEVPVFVSPHYYYPHDHEWNFGGALEKMMHAVGMFDRAGALTTDGLSGSGADWHEPLRHLIEHENVVVTSPHKVYGPESNDLVLQLRKRGVDKVILAGMSANLCVEAHLRELTEQGWVEDLGGFTRGGERLVPLFDPKMAGQFQHRAASVGLSGNQFRKLSKVPSTEEELRVPDYEPSPAYWVSDLEVHRR